MTPPQRFVSSNVNSCLSPCASNLNAKSRALEIVTAILKKRHDERKLELLEASLYSRAGMQTVAAQEWPHDLTREQAGAARTLVDDIIAARR